MRRVSLLSTLAGLVVMGAGGYMVWETKVSWDAPMDFAIVLTPFVGALNVGRGLSPAALRKRLTPLLALNAMTAIPIALWFAFDLESFAAFVGSVAIVAGSSAVALFDFVTTLPSCSSSMRTR